MKTAVRWCVVLFNAGMTHFDLANNYGPPAGSTEETFGQILREELMPHRDELVTSVLIGASSAIQIDDAVGML